MHKIINISEIAQRLIDGEVGVLPTDTVYGLVASAYKEVAVAKIYELKRRMHEPGTIVAASVDHLIKLGLDERYLHEIERYWPGAISVIVPYEGPRRYLHLGKKSLAVRVPEDEFLRNILEVAGSLVTSSANLSGEPVANNIEQAFQYFGDKADFYVDGGDLSDSQSSTIIKISPSGLEILRQGAVIIDDF